jgi:hypothetical protein
MLVDGGFFQDMPIFFKNSPKAILLDSPTLFLSHQFVKIHHKKKTLAGRQGCH